MLKRTPDRRIDRTRQALLSAFVELVLTEGYETLTAAHISRRANVGRSTFYLHFTGKEALLKESIKHPSSRLAACVNAEITPQQLTPLLEHFREQRTVNRAFFEYPIRPLWVNSLAALIEPRLALAVRGGNTRPALPKSLVALMVAEMQVALITHWLKRQPALQAEAIAAVLIANTRAMISAR